MLYESCRDRELQICVGDLPRREAFLIEQYLHSQLTAYRELIPQLEENTQKIMAFHDFLNERCDLHELADRATRLGEILETRFAMEDEMLEVLHYAHSPEKTLG